MIHGETVVINPAKLGYPLTAFIRLRLALRTGKSFYEACERTTTLLAMHCLVGSPS